jgi:hypothetical protein
MVVVGFFVFFFLFHSFLSLWMEAGGGTDMEACSRMSYRCRLGSIWPLALPWVLKVFEATLFLALWMGQWRWHFDMEACSLSSRFVALARLGRLVFLTQNARS